MKLCVIIQARMSSTRLPGKVMMSLGGQPVLARMIERVTSAHTPFDLVVATTTDPADEPIVSLCRDLKVECYRGHPTDLVERHWHAARMVEADALVKIPSDCPLIDPGVLDRVLGFWNAFEGHYDYVSNLHPATYPDGNDVEVLTMEALAIVRREARQDFEREHLTPYVWENPFRFRIGNITWERGLNFSRRYRWTLDYAEDMDLITHIFETLQMRTGPLFSLDDIVQLLQNHPELERINSRYRGVNWYRKHIGQLHTVGHSDTAMEPIE
ncbi:MAG TPA: glycosyltransferase family protein [Bacteroidota bacterium]|nr:glycosyltransferase family protein [Bacteroidota bacterium]